MTRIARTITAALGMLLMALLFVPVAPAAHAAASHYNTDPYSTGCSASAYTLATHPVSGGTASIKVSRSCGTNWLEYSGTKQTTTKRTKDHATNKWTRTEVDNAKWSYSMQSYAPGTTKLTATVKIGTKTTTATCTTGCSWTTATDTPAPAPITVIGDNYPHKSATPCGSSAWCVNGSWYHPTRLFAYRNCTDFVAYRLNTANKVAFTNNFKGVTWGNAKQWRAAAQQAGYRVDSTPKRGAIAYSSAGTYGHVAWVERVNSNGTVVIEEYNYGTTGKYNRRTVNTSAFQYIHVKDL